MSLENEDRQQHLETGHKVQKKLKISYTRDFLLSISELEVCKKLPSGFDQSLQSELEDSLLDRSKISGSLSSQSFRRNEYGSSPPTRGDITNYSRGIQVRWDSRSSGRIDRDSDLKSDLDSDSGRRYGNQSRRSWQVPEHDGLLGSGSFPRPAGYPTGTPASKFRANEHYQLNRSNEPYQPPRPYKAVAHSRRDTHDSFNDETFGSSEFTDEDRAEEERKRRASFELLRKEQQKAFQEKQKLNPERRKDDFDIALLMEDSKDDNRPADKNNESDEQFLHPVSKNDSIRSSFLTPAPISRPLVPPGFASTISEKNGGTKSLNQSNSSEVSNELDASLLHAKGNRVLNVTSNTRDEKESVEQMNLSEQQPGSPSIQVSLNNKSEMVLNLSSAFDVSSKTGGMDDQFYKTSLLSKAFEVSENSKVIEFGAQDTTGNEIVDESSPAHSISILEKIFGSALTLNGIGSSSFTKHHDVRADETQIPHNVQSSKFAQWFLEEEKKPVDDLPSGRSNDLLSLIGGGEKIGSQVFDVKATEHIPPNSDIQSPAVANMQMTSNLLSAKVDNNDNFLSNEKPDAVPAVLTCEDLEQSILSEITEIGSTLPQPIHGCSHPARPTEQQRVHSDDRASQHLLSLLQRGTGPKDMVPSANVGVKSSDIPQNTEPPNIIVAVQNSGEVDSENIPNSGKPLTLETLFGTAFMKELQSVGSPASQQRGCVGSAKINVSVSHGLPLPVMSDGLPGSTDDISSSMSSHGNVALPSNQRQHLKMDRIEEHLLGFNSCTEVDSSQNHSELGSSLGGFEGSLEFRLPEEDSLITVSDPLNLQNSMPYRNSAKAESSFIPEAPVGITEKLAALNSVFRNERPVIVDQEGPNFLHGPYDTRETNAQYHNLHVQPSSPQFLPPQLNHVGPMFHQLDYHPASNQMKFMAPENVIHHDTPNHQFPVNMIRPPFHRPGNGFDRATHNPMLQQTNMPGNFPPPQLLRGFPRGAPVPSHLHNQVPGFVQEPNPMQGFPFGQRQPNFGGPGIPPQAPNVGVGSATNHPEALQRLIEMELRSKTKQMHPLAAASHSQGMYGHERDMGYGYR